MRNELYDGCRRGARDGCGAFRLGQELADALTGGIDREDAEEIMERIDESWKRKNDKSGASGFAFDDNNGEFQIALTLAIHGHKVMSRNDDQRPPHAGDAWVDDMRADFKSLNSNKMTRLWDALRSSEKQQEVDLVVIDACKSGTSEEDAREGFRQFNKPGRVMQRVIVFGRGYIVGENVG